MCGSGKSEERITKWQKEEPTSYTNYRVVLLVLCWFLYIHFWGFQKKRAKRNISLLFLIGFNVNVQEFIVKKDFPNIYLVNLIPLYGNQMKNVEFRTSNYSKFWDDQRHISWLSVVLSRVSIQLMMYTRLHRGDPAAFLNHKELQQYKVRNTQLAL